MLRVSSAIIACVVLVAASVQQNQPASVPGAELTFAVDFGGSGFDSIADIAVGPDGSLHVVGTTLSADLPTVNPAQSTSAGGPGVPVDAFVARLDPVSGKTIFATYLGGFGIEESYGIAVDQDGNSYVVGGTDAANFPVLNAGQQNNAGLRDAFVASYDPQGQLRFSTLFGGSGNDIGFDIEVDPEGSVWIAGETQGITSVDPLQDPGGSVDAFIAKFSPAGDQILFASPLGGSNSDRARALAISDGGHVFITGESLSGDFPTVGGLQGVAGGSSDIFVTQLDMGAQNILYSTRFGGSGADEPRGIELDSLGRAYVAGISWSNDFPIVNPTQATFGGSSDAVLAILSRDGDMLEFATYLGSTEGDQAFDLSIFEDSLVMMVGQTFSPGFPDDVDPLVESGGEVPRSFVTAFSGVTDSISSVAFSSTMPGAESLTGSAIHSAGRLALAGFSRAGVGSSGNTDNGFVGLLDVFSPPPQPPELVVRKSLIELYDPDGNVVVGEGLEYEIVVTNEGGPATNVQVIDRFESGGKILEVRNNPNTVSEDEIHWVIPNLGAGESRRFRLTATAFTSGLPIANAAWAVNAQSTSTVARISDPVYKGPVEVIALYLFPFAGTQKKSDAIDVYVDSTLVFNGLAVDVGVRLTDSIGTLRPVLDIVDDVSPNNSAPISSSTIDWFTDTDTLFAFSDRTILLIAPSGDSLLPVTRLLARFESGDAGTVDMTIAQAAEDAGGVDVRTSGSITNSADGVEFGHFTDYWSGPAGSVDVELTLASDALTLGTWRFDLSSRGGEAVTLVVGPTAPGKSAVPTMFGIDAQGKRFEATAITATEGLADLPTEFQVFANYPNPFSGSTRFVILVNEALPVKIWVYDVLGRQVKKVDAGHLQAGRHDVEFDATGLTPGVYFYQVTLGDATRSGRMVVRR